MQYTSNPELHLKSTKLDVDLLYVIAYGPSQVKPPAVQMLFHYWPNLKPPGAISEYRGLQYTASQKPSKLTATSTYPCGHCPEEGQKMLHKTYTSKKQTLHFQDSDCTVCVFLRHRLLQKQIETNSRSKSEISRRSYWWITFLH
ncbi:hypothetical protein P7K49_018518 [Saguinus oedipus]|uniref:Uncharacterized protein n=1 Tax=Saguinus oedipus TaxID=9490 RepID=A0ABQ9V8D3_SAGOE|nr:hypothetical protein P7K49_018518 [Saguinus oedipus]